LVEHPNYHHVRQGTQNVAILQWARSIAIPLFLDFLMRRNCDISYTLKKVGIGCRETFCNWQHIPRWQYKIAVVNLVSIEESDA
jgi:hypothetical protein